MHALICDVPCEMARTIIDLSLEPVERRVQCLRACGFTAVKCRLRSGESFRLAAVDLPAVACTLIADDRPQAGIDERFRSAHPGRTGTDDDQARVGHDASGCSVRMERPAL